MYINPNQADWPKLPVVETSWYFPRLSGPMDNLIKDTATLELFCWLEPGADLPAHMAACSSAESARKSDSWRRGTARQCPGLSGKASRNAAARSFSATRSPAAKRSHKGHVTV